MYGPRRALPILRADLPVIIGGCDLRTARGVRDRAILLLGWALMLRRSEISALNLADIKHVSGEGMVVTIRRSKTDNDRIDKYVHYAKKDQALLPGAGGPSLDEHRPGSAPRVPSHRSCRNDDAGAGRCHLWLRVVFLGHGRRVNA